MQVALGAAAASPPPLEPATATVRDITHLDHATPAAKSVTMAERRQVSVHMRHAHDACRVHGMHVWIELVLKRTQSIGV